MLDLLLMDRYLAREWVVFAACVLVMGAYVRTRPGEVDAFGLALIAVPFGALAYIGTCSIRITYYALRRFFQR